MLTALGIGEELHHIP